MPSPAVPVEQKRPWGGWWPERLASLAAVGGSIGSLLPGFHPSTWPPSATDFKTLYAAIWNMVHGVDAYSFPRIAEVFLRNHVTPPEHWYSHAPVYPPFTLAVLSPLSLLPLVTAIYVFLLISGLAIAGAAATLARAGGERFGLPRGWRLALIALVAAAPLVSYGLDVGNVSVVVAACCIYAVAAPQAGNPWLRAAALTLGLLLKPHLALWVLIALAVASGRQGRRVAIETCALTGVALAGLLGWLAVKGQLISQSASYLHMVRQEIAVGGSMHGASHEILTTTAQITALHSLFGYWTADMPWLPPFATPIVLLLGLLLAWLSLRRTGSAANHPFAIAGAWCGFGLLTTYHRAHDAIVLLVLLPWLLARLRYRWTDLVSWLVLVSFTLLCLGPDLDMLNALERTPPLHILAGVFLRQSPFFVLVLTITLIVAIARRRAVPSLLAVAPVPPSQADSRHPAPLTL